MSWKRGVTLLVLGLAGEQGVRAEGAKQPPTSGSQAHCLASTVLLKPWGVNEFLSSGACAFLTWSLTYPCRLSGACVCAAYMVWHECVCLCSMCI